MIFSRMAFPVYNPVGPFCFDYLPGAADGEGGCRCLEDSETATSLDEGAVDGDDKDWEGGSGAIFSRFSGSMLDPEVGETT